MLTSIATKRAVGYLRVSSVGQTGERHSSLETQEARFNDYCERLGLLAVTCFVDIVSGRRDDRKEYHRMLDYVEEGGPMSSWYSSWTASGVIPGRSCSGSGSFRTMGFRL